MSLIGCGSQGSAGALSKTCFASISVKQMDLCQLGRFSAAGNALLTSSSGCETVVWRRETSGITQLFQR